MTLPWDEKDRAPMSWAYIAGFTDGEGSISVKQNKSGVTSFSVTLYQNENQAYVLCEIQDFLEELGIDSRIYRSERLDARHPTIGYFLYVRRVRDVYRFCKEIQPYAHVKEDAIKLVLHEIERKAAKSSRRIYEGLGD